ncbi:MAG: hypothetical protein ACP5NC_06425 [Nitrososphaeria archaeon]
MISKNSLLKMLLAFGAGGFVGLFLYNRLASAPQAGTVRLRRQKLPQSYIAALVPLAAALNLVGGYIVSITRVPIFLDMMGTAVTAFTIGPWWAAITGIITNIGESIIISPIYLPFAVVNVAGGLLWGYGAKWGMAKSFVRLLILGIAVAILSSLISVPIITFVFGGATGVPNDVITAALLASGKSLLSSVFISNIIASLSDKIISTFIAVAIVAALPPVLKSNIELAQYRGMKLVAYALIGIIIGLIIMIAIMYGVFH